MPDSVRFPGPVVVHPVSIGGDMHDWAVYAEGNWVATYSDRAEAVAVAKRTSEIVTGEVGS